MIMFAHHLFSNGLLSSPPRVLAAIAGIGTAYFLPTVPYAVICVLAVFIDCLTAWRLNRRIKKRCPTARADGKLKSARMSKMISDLTIVWLCILLANAVELQLLPHLGGLHLAQYVAAIFVFCTVISILENESSCNGAVWARVVQHVVANKVSRHLHVSEHDFDELLHGDDDKSK